MVIEQRGKRKFILWNKAKTKILGTHTSRAGAEEQERAIQISEARKKGHKIPYPKKKKRG